jgi:BlaI family transcriptional regulator, penicillinase repressor
MAEQTSPTGRELEILKILWRRGTATVREVYEEMRLDENLAQTTVQSFLRLMEEKGLVRHRTQGRSFVYQPLYTRERTLSRFLNHVFDGAVDQLMVNALKVKKLSDEEMAALEGIIRDARKAKQK